VTPDPDENGEVHHIIERALWTDGGYIPENGVCVCTDHHKHAEQNNIPPQTFWKWAEITDPVVPTNTTQINKWGDEFETPPHADIREYHKYPSTRHLLPLYWQSPRGTVSERTERDDTGHQSVESFRNIPCIVMTKMDGSNAMLVADADEPVRARNGRHAEHESFDRLKQEYWNRNVYESLPDHIQLFGENMYAKHSIHYGCDGCCDERNQGPPVTDVFLVFGAYDTRYNIWCSWPETVRLALDVGFTPVQFFSATYKHVHELKRSLTTNAQRIVDNGHEGIVIRPKFPFHWGQFDQYVGKYVRPNHVQTDEHWSQQRCIQNKIREDSGK
jgi:hypothetical protein